MRVKRVQVFKTCKVCKEKYAPFLSTQKACSGTCALALIRKDAKQKEDKAHRERKREFKANDKPTQAKSAQTAFNAFIRYRDKGEPCISCDKPSTWTGKWAAGHFHTRGARSDIRFNEDNCHKQCDFYCNCSLSGNLLEYRPRLIEKIGIKRYEALEKVEIVKYTAEDYRNIAKHYRDKLRDLQKVAL